MTDQYRLIVARARAEYEEKERTKLDKSNQERIVRQARTEKEIAALNMVESYLVQAKKELSAENIPCVIEEDFDIEGSSRRPTLRFKCVGPERKNQHGVNAVPTSKQLFILFDGETFEAKLAKGYGKDRWAKDAEPLSTWKVGAPDFQSQVQFLIERVVQSYFANFEGDQQ